MILKEIKYLILFLVILVNPLKTKSQSIAGSCNGFSNQTIYLYNSFGFNDNLISSVNIDDEGNFVLNFDENHYGGAYLTVNNIDKINLILDNENIVLSIENIQDPSTVNIIDGEKSKRLFEFNKISIKTQLVYGALNYLLNIYSKDDFWTNESKSNWILEELINVEAKKISFYDRIKEDHELFVLLNYIDLIQSSPIIVNYNPELIDETINQYRNIDYSLNSTWNSGWYKSLIENQIEIILNSGFEFETIQIELQKSIDYLISNLQKDENKLNETAIFLFDFFSNRNYYDELEYLINSLSNLKNYSIDEQLNNNFELYSKLKTGAFAPNIVFDNKYVFSNENKISDLKQLQSELILLVFGSSKCYNCIQEIPLIQDIYTNFKDSKKLEIVLISLDENEHDFKHFTENFSFISVCSFEKYSSQAVKDYNIQHTPSFYLLNKDLKILLKPSSSKHLENWLYKY